MKKFKNMFLKAVIVPVLLLVMVVATHFNVKAQSVAVASPSYSTNITYTSAAATNLLVFTNSVKIAQVQVLAGATFANIGLYDNNATNATYTNAAYVTRLEYSTNAVSTFVSPLTGMTNIQTNLQWFETTVTNGISTNNFPTRNFVAPANTLGTYPVNILMSKGLAFSGTAGTNVTVIITYRVND